MHDISVENNLSGSDSSSDSCWSEVDKSLDVDILKSIEEIKDITSATEDSESEEQVNNVNKCINFFPVNSDFNSDTVIDLLKRYKQNSDKKIDRLQLQLEDCNSIGSSDNQKLIEKLHVPTMSSNDESDNSSSSNEGQPHVKNDDKNFDVPTAVSELNSAIINDNNYSEKSLKSPSHIIDSSLIDSEAGMKKDVIAPILQLDERLYEHVSREAALHYEDITSDDEVWLIHCPKSIQPSGLHHRKVSLDQPSTVTLKTGQDVQIKPFGAPETRVTCVLPSASDNMHYKAVVLNLAGQLMITENVDVPEVHIPDVIRSKVPFPPNLKIRHPLFGADYKKEIEQRQQSYSNGLNVIKHKEKRRKSDGDSCIRNNSPELPKHKKKISLSRDDTFITENTESDDKRRKKKRKSEKKRAENHIEDTSEIEFKVPNLSKSFISNTSISSEDSDTKSKKKKRKDKKRSNKISDSNLEGDIKDSEFGSPILNSTKFVNTDTSESYSVVETTNDNFWEILGQKNKKKKKKHKNKSKNLSDTDDTATSVIKHESDDTNLTLDTNVKKQKRKYEEPVLSSSLSENLIDHIPKKKRKLYKIRYSSLDEGASLSHL